MIGMLARSYYDLMLTRSKFSTTVIQLCINDHFRLTCDALLELYQSTEEARSRILTFWEINAF